MDEDWIAGSGRFIKQETCTTRTIDTDGSLLNIEAEHGIAITFDENFENLHEPGGKVCSPRDRISGRLNECLPCFRNFFRRRGEGEESHVLLLYEILDERFPYFCISKFPFFSARFP